MGFLARSGSVLGKARTGGAMVVDADVIKTFAKIGGFDNAKHMALAAKGIYGQSAEGVRSEIITNPNIWPAGWTVVGDGWYGLSDSVKGTNTAGLLPNLETIHAATVLVWCGGGSGLPGRGFQQGDVMIACRGTDFGLEGFTEGSVDLNTGILNRSDFTHPATGAYVGKVHTGFYDAYKSIFLGKISGSMSLFETVLARGPHNIYVTGHSLGGAMSHLVALGLDLLSRALGIDTKVKVCSFAAPRVCNCRVPPSAMCASFRNSSVIGIRVVNKMDPVPFLPGAIGGFGAATVGVASSLRFDGGSIVGASKSILMYVASPLIMALGELGNAGMGAMTGIWDHPEFDRITFSDTGRSAAAGHPHSMDVYSKLINDLAPRLDA